MLLNLNLQEMYKYFEDNKSKNEIQFLAKYETNNRDILVADACQQARQLINEDRGMMKVESCRRGGKDTMLDFMSCLTENTLSKVFIDKNAIQSRKVKVVSPPVASYLIDKRKEDFIMIQEDQELNFDLKSQYFRSSTNSLNINKNSHERFCKNGSDFYIVALIRNNNTDYKNFRNVNSIYFFLLTKSYIEENAELKFGKTPYYAIEIKRFIDVLKLVPSINKKETEDYRESCKTILK